VDNAIIFQPLKFKNLVVKNRLFRSSISGRFDNYDGSGSQARVNWEEKFARGGVGAIISSFVPVHIEGRILPNYAMIDSDDKIPFWRAVGKKVHEYDCKYILQLSHGGRQRDNPGVENFKKPGFSSTSKADPVHGLQAQAMTREHIARVVQWFAAGARRARDAGLDGIELHSSHGYLFTQFLSSGINDREDEYGGSLENRARFLLDVIRAIRKEVGSDFHLQVKLNTLDLNDAVGFFEKKGNTLEESIQICQWAEAAGADAIHASLGSIFPHPLMPPGGTPPDEMNWWYNNMLSSGARGYLNYTMFHFRTLRGIIFYFWNRAKRNRPVEGVCIDEARAVKKAVTVPVLCTGGFQSGKLIRQVLSDGSVDAVSIARPLIANNDLPMILQKGHDLPERPCSFCNRCLVNAVANPLGCYDIRRFDGDHDQMIHEVMSVYRPAPFS
jgi:2,4-dienoyl-CoA reductase-like NADH-dependent reductase (Old Yellow Enzyme family)